MSLSRDLKCPGGNPEILEVLEDEGHQLVAVVILDMQHLSLVLLNAWNMKTLPPLPFLVPAR